MIMIELSGEANNSAERHAVNLLKKLITDYCPDIETNEMVKCTIITSATCYGEEVQDIDVLLLFFDHRPLSVQRGIKSICLALEIKAHGPESIKFEGNNCYVRYKNKWHNASNQSEKQKYSIRDYIDKNTENFQPPFVTNLIWLVNVPSSALVDIPTNNIVGSDVSWDDLVTKLSTDKYPIAHAFFRSQKLYTEVKSIFSKKFKISRIDKRRLDVITKSILDKSTQQYASKLGEQLLIYRGRGGTGKTIRLIQTAYQAYSDYGYRVIILTYNKSLVADIKRLLAFAKVKSTVSGSEAIAISTVHSFMYKWLNKAGYHRKGDNQFLEFYENYKTKFIDDLTSDAKSSAKLDSLRSNNPIDLDWDLLLIDEAQDWPSNERDLLYKIYGYRNFIIADGVDQFVRSSHKTDWRQGIDKKQSQIVTLRKSLRLKNSLCNLVNGLAEDLGLKGWNLDPESSLYGGRVIYVTGNPLSRSFHKKLASTVVSDGNEPIDILLCVPPTWVVKTQPPKIERVSTVAKCYKEWGLEVWDAVNEETRSSYPIDCKQHRIVQYDSCRGLEGWLVINFGLDELYDYKLNLAQKSGITSEDILITNEEAQENFAKQWVMIPLTRAIDTLVIHVSNPNSYIGQIMEDLVEQFPEAIDKYHFE